MTSNDDAAEKRTAVEYLEFGATTVKRVTWEMWEFTVVGSHLVEVTNASYGHLKDEHVYTVGVEERDGLVVPAECECPADIHHKADCKHKVALATVGGPTVLKAAINFEAPSAPSSDSTSETARPPLTADGGRAAEPVESERKTCPNGDPTCPGPEADADTLPCFACYGATEEA